MQDQTVTQSPAAVTPVVEQPRGIPVDGTPQRLHPSSLSLHRIAGWIRAAILSGIMLIVGIPIVVFASWPILVRIGLLGVMGLLVLGLVWLAQFWPAISYRYRSYSLDELGIEIRRGVMFRRVITVPRSRVQHTDVNQGPIERQLGLAHLVIHTAGTVSAAVSLDGLGFETALEIRSHLVASGSGDAV